METARERKVNNKVLYRYAKGVEMHADTLHICPDRLRRGSGETGARLQKRLSMHTELLNALGTMMTPHC
eukprot:6534336-Lingulodinium_polyedra.AAC.1